MFQINFMFKELLLKLLEKKLFFGDLSHFDSYVEAYINTLDSIPKDSQDNDYKVLYNLLIKNHNSIRNWFNKDYLSYSQECINSHYFSDRLDKKPNTFTTSSLDKLCDLMNAKYNNFLFKNNTKESYYDIPLQFDNSPKYSFDVRKTLKHISGL